MNYELIAQNLQQRIGQMAAGYEGQIAVLQAQFQTEVQRLQAELAELQSKLSKYEADVEEEATGTESTDATD